MFLDFFYGLRDEGVPVEHVISGATGQGVRGLLRALRTEIDNARAAERGALEEVEPWMP